MKSTCVACMRPMVIGLKRQCAGGYYCVPETISPKSPEPTRCPTCDRYKEVWPSTMLIGNEAALCANWHFHGLTAMEYVEVYEGMKQRKGPAITQLQRDLEYYRGYVTHLEGQLKALIEASAPAVYAQAKIAQAQRLAFALVGVLTHEPPGPEAELAIPQNGAGDN